jgi:hypothetical protein
MNEPLPQPPTDFLSISLPKNQGEYQLPEGLLDEDSVQEKIRQHNLDEEKKKDDYAADATARSILQERRKARDAKQKTRDAKRKAEFQVGEKVKIKTWRFGKKYAKGLPEYTEGKVVYVKGTRTGVLFKGDKKVSDTNNAHLEKCKDGYSSSQDNVVATVIYKGRRYKKSQTFYTIMASLEVGSALKKVGRK